MAFLIYYKDHNIDVKRCKEVRHYILDGKQYNYFPDFVIDGVIYEIKGIKDELSDAKKRYNQDIVFLYRKDMEKYIQYAKNKYGDFIDLYDKKDK